VRRLAGADDLIGHLRRDHRRDGETDVDGR
jgi:hypothetical protein